MSDNDYYSSEEERIDNNTLDHKSVGDNHDNPQSDKDKNNKDDQSDEEYDENINYDQSGMEDNDMDEDPSTFVNPNENIIFKENNKTSDRVKMSDIFGSDNEESSNDERASYREKPRSQNEVRAENESNSDDGGHYQNSFERERQYGEGIKPRRLSNSPPDDNDYEKHDGSEEENDSKSPPSANTQQQPLQEILIEAEMPRVRPDMLVSASVSGKKDQNVPDLAQQQNEIHFVKLPNFLSVEPKAFNPSTYEDEIDEDEIYDEEGRTRVKLRVENTVRWRFKPELRDSHSGDNNGLENKESNAKIIRWSDGSMSLQVGSEYFDVYKSVILNDFNHLFVRQGTGLQGQAVFKTKLSFRPHSTNSITHRKMTLSLANRCSKAQKIKVLASVGADPETGKAEIYKKEEEKFRASIRRDNQKRRLREKMGGLGGGYNKHSTGKGNQGSDVSFSDNEDEDRASNSIAAIKNSYKKGDFGHRGLDVLPPPYVTTSNKFGSRSGHTGPPVKETRPKIYSSDSDEDGNYESRNESEKRSKKPVKVISVSDDDE